MPLELTPFPIVPEQRTALTSAGIRQYITSPAWANFGKLEELIESIETQFSTFPITYKSASLPDSANLFDRWVDESEGNQEKICVNAYTSGNGLVGDWESMHDAATLTLATSAFNLATSTSNSRASDFPAAYTENWLFVNSTTGAIYYCIETYDATFTGDRATKYQVVVDESAAANFTNVQSQIDNFASDNIISSIEKRTLQREWNQIVENKGLSDTLATTLNQTSASQYIALVSAYTTLDTYLNTSLNVFGDLNSDTALSTFGTTRTVWNTNWSAWYTAQRTFADFINTELDTDIDNVQTDETITQAEARDAETRWNYEVQNYAQHNTVTDSLNASGIINKITDTTWIAYDNAYNALNVYLNTKLILFSNTTWPLLLSTKSSSATEWKQKWQDLTDAERGLSELTNNTFATQIDALADDGTIAKGGEKILANQSWSAIFGTDGSDGEYALLINRANALIAAGNSSLTGDRDSLTNAYNSLKAYLDGITDFYDTTKDSAVVNSTWDSTWGLYYQKYAALDKSASDISDVSLGLVSGLVNDELVTAGKEKQELIELFDRITIEKGKMQTKALIGVGADDTVYITAYNDLQSFLYGLFTGGDAPAFNNKDLGSNAVNRSVWKQKFDDYFEAREDLENAILENNTAFLNRDSAAIPSMATDGDITIEEKAVAKTYWDVIFGVTDTGEHNALSTQATSLGVTQTYIDTFDDAFTVLWNFITDDSHGSPNSASSPASLSLFDDMFTLTSLSISQQTFWQQYWNEYYTARDALVLQIQATLTADLNSKLERDGTDAGMSGNLKMNNNLLTSLAQASATGQAVEYDQWNTKNGTQDTAIGNAQTAANDAQTDADTAQTTADNANTNANTKLPKDGSEGMSGDLGINKIAPIVQTKPSVDGADAGIFRVVNAAGTTAFASMSSSFNNQYWKASSADAGIALDVQGKNIVNVPDTPSAGASAINRNFLDAALNTVARSGAGGQGINGNGAVQNVDIGMVGQDFADAAATWSFNCNIVLSGGADYGIVNIAGHYNQGTWYGFANYLRTFSSAVEAQAVSMTTLGLITFTNQNANTYSFDFSVPSAQTVRCGITAPVGFDVRYQIVV